MQLKITVSRAQYTKAALLHARRTGVLRFFRTGLAGAACLAALGIVFFAQTYPSGGFTGVWCALLTAGGVLPGAALVWVIPRQIRQRAALDWAVFNELANPAVYEFSEDGFTFAAASVRTNDPYARMDGLIETPELMVIVRDRKRMAVLPRRQLTPEAEDFLRMTFVRRHRRRRSWM